MFGFLKRKPKDEPKGKPGFHQGKHYTEYVEQVKELKRTKRLEEAEQLLLALVDAVEAENHVEKFGVAPGYYEHLAIIYRGRKDYAAEIAILERCNRQPYSRGAMFVERIEKARALQAGQSK